MNYVEIRREADEIAREISHLLPSVRDLNVAPIDLDDFREMAWAGEAKLGIETLCEQLEENSLLLPKEIAERLRKFGEKVGVGQSYLKKISAEP